MDEACRGSVRLCSIAAGGGNVRDVAVLLLGGVATTRKVAQLRHIVNSRLTEWRNCATL